MNHEIKHGPSFASLHLELDKGEKVRTEAGAMVAMSADMDIETKVYGGFLKALIRKLLGGESVFQNTYSPQDGKGSLVLSPTTPGQIVHYQLAGNALILQASAFLASLPEVGLKTSYGGVKSMLSGEGLFLLEASGTGDLWFNAYGNIVEIEIDGEYVVDTGHIVAFEPGLKFKVAKVGGWKATLLSGEGLVCKFTGKGKLWMQTHNAPGFGQFIGSKLPPRQG